MKQIDVNISGLSRPIFRHVQIPSMWLFFAREMCQF